MDIVYLNGMYIPACDAKISVFDRGFLYGDSVYEVVPFYQGQGFRFEEHLSRLAYSLRQVGISTELDFSTIMKMLVEHNGGGNLSVYLQVSRGNYGERIAAIDSEVAPTVFACCRPIVDNYSQSPEDIRGIAAVVLPDMRDGRCDIKSTCLQPNILTLNDAHALGAVEAIQLRNGYITEGTSSNIFIVKDGQVLTPSLGKNILGGVTRQLLLELAEANHIPCKSTQINHQQLLHADEVWISSSTRAVVPVTTVDGQPISNGVPGPLWRQMYLLFTQHHQALMTGLKHD